MELPSGDTGEAGKVKLLQLVGLARRAGYAVVGTSAVKEALRRTELNVIVLATDASENAIRRVQGTMDDAGVTVVSCATRQELGRAVGRPEAVIVGIRDRGLASRIAGHATEIAK